jgi:phospholipase C
MMRHRRKRYFFHGCRMGLSALALGQFCLGPVLADEAQNHGDHRYGDHQTQTPIKHAIVIIGENRSFDHVFATYVPKQPGQSVNNLLSEGIITLGANKAAYPGHNFQKAHQLAAQDVGSTDAFLLNPPKQPFPNDQLPAPLVGGPKVSYIPNQCSTSTPITECPASLALAKQSESGLEPGYYPYLLSGGTGQTSQTPDQRLTNVNALPAGPFQLTNGSAFTYDSYSASPVHRFYQMWQQLNCSNGAASRDNPSGCTGNLFAWVEVTVGAGTNGVTQPENFSTEYAPNATTTGEGSTAQGDVRYFTSLVDNYAMSDNFHQSVDGGTGANHIMFGHADAIWFSDANGSPAAPPNGQQLFHGRPRRGHRPRG